MNAAALDRLNQVFRQVFDDDELSVSRETTSSQVDGWDSLKHVVLLLNVEKAFGIKLSSAQVAGLKNVGELMDLIDKATAGGSKQ